MVSDIHMPEASLNSLIMDYSSNCLTIIAIDSRRNTLEADILEESMPPYQLLSCF